MNASDAEHVKWFGTLQSVFKLVNKKITKTLDSKGNADQKNHNSIF